MHTAPIVSIIISAWGVAAIMHRRLGIGLVSLLGSVGILSYCYLQVIAYTLLDAPLLGLLAHEAVELIFLILLGEFLAGIGGSILSTLAFQENAIRIVRKYIFG